MLFICLDKNKLIEIQYCESSMIRTFTSDRTTQLMLSFHELLQDVHGRESTVPYVY